jgi:small subunit ribosomal protein S16
MVRIRLRRVGRRHKPIYRVVAAESRAPRDGDFIEILGYYNPLTDPPTISIDEAKALKWLGQGAKPSDTVHRLLAKTGILQKATPQA